MSLISEKEIIEKVLGGDVNAFEELVLRYEKTVYNLALRMVSDRDDAFDMTQEAFIKAYNSLPSFRGDSKFSVWLYRITTNICLDFLRSKKRRPQVSLTAHDDEDEDVQLDIPDPAADPEGQLIKKLGMQSLSEGLKLLPDKQRQILVMRELGGMSYAEIMGKDLAVLLECDMICFAKGWHLSKGCCIEFAVAKELRLKMGFE